MTLDEKARVEEIGRTYTMERIYKLEDWNGSKVLWVHYDVQFLLAQLTAANAKIEAQDKVLKHTISTLDYLRANHEIYSAILEYLDGHWNLWSDIEAILEKGGE